MIQLRIGQSALLTRPIAQALEPLPLVVFPAIAFAVASLPWDPMLRVRLGAVALCLSAAFLLDDPAADTVASAPSSLAFRRAHRLLLWVPVLAALWALLLWYAGAPAVVARSLELAALLAVTLAAAAGLGGVVAGPTVLGVVVAGWTLATCWPVVNGVWISGALLAVGVSALVLMSRDPGRPGA